MQQATYEAVLDGFSRVKKCSNEGRAGMTIDLSGVDAGFKAIQRGNKAAGKAVLSKECARGKVHVDAYLKACFLGEADMMEWVKANWEAYSYRHLLGLLNQNIKSMISQKRIKEAIAELDSLYAQEQQFGEEQATRRRSMFNSKDIFQNKKGGNS